MSKATAVYLAIWRRAMTSKKDLCLDLGSEGNALSFKMGLYRAIKPYRDGKLFDEVLVVAADTLMVSLLKGSSSVTIKIKTEEQTMNSMIESLGLTEAELLTPEELKMKDALSNFLTQNNEVEKLMEGPVADSSDPLLTAPNPFYTSRG